MYQSYRLSVENFQGFYKLRRHNPKKAGRLRLKYQNLAIASPSGDSHDLIKTTAVSIGSISPVVDTKTKRISKALDKILEFYDPEYENQIITILNCEVELFRHFPAKYQLVLRSLSYNIIYVATNVV